MYQVSIKENSMVTKVQQIVNSLVGDIESGSLENEYKLPSINIFSKINRVARDTVEKAYKQLRKQGYIASVPGKGYFVVGKCNKQPKLLLITDKPSSFNSINYVNLLDKLVGYNKGEWAIDFCYPESFKELTEESLRKYDYYIIRPGLFLR